MPERQTGKALGCEADPPDIDIAEARRRAQRGPRPLLISRAVVLGITFASTITVARLVGPQAYGLAAMSSVIFTFAQVFRDFGVTNAVLRKGHITRSELNVIFWFNVVATTAISLILVAVAPAVAAFYHEPIVFWTMMCSVVGFQVGGVALQHRALINRELRFGSIALIDVAGLLVGFVVTLVLAAVRHDVWALVIGSVCQSITSAVLAFCLSRWRPGRPTRESGLGDLVRFGANSTVHSLSVLVSNNAAAVLVGHQFGAALLGQYSRAQTLFSMPGTNLIQPITQSAMPLLTRLRVHPLEYRAAYLDLVRRLCVFLMPLAVVFSFTAVPLTELLLGDRWHTAGLVLTALAPTLAFVGMAYAVSDVFVTQDRSVELRNVGVSEVVLRVGAILVGLQFGLVETALAYSGATIVVAVLRVLVAGRRGPVTGRDQIGAALVGLLPAVGASAGCLAAHLLGPATGLGCVLAVTLGGFAGSVLGAIPRSSSRTALTELSAAFGLSRVISIVRPARRS